MECYDCGKEISGEGITTQRSSTHRDIDTVICRECAVKAGENIVTNKDRAELARSLLNTAHSTYGGSTVHDIIVDIIADLLHLARVEKADPEAILRSALFHFHDEVIDEICDESTAEERDRDAEIDLEIKRRKEER